MKTICVVNAPQDAKAAAQLKKHMTMQYRNGLYQAVDDVAGAQVVVVLMSNDFLVDERAYAMSEQAKRKHAAGACRIIPILVEYMSEIPDHLVMLRALPRSGKPAETDAQWAEIAGDLRAIGMI